MSEMLSLPFDRTGRFSRLIEDFQNFHPNLRPFIRDFPSVSSVLEYARQRPVLTDRALLSGAISDTFAETPMTGEQRQKLKMLSSDRCFTITTGHQLNLMGGPMYVIYKVQSAINLCRLLNERQEEMVFVPVFWLASEDHDLAEVNHFRFQGETFTWDTRQTGAVGRMNTEGMARVISSIRAGLPVSQALSEFMEAAERAAAKSTTAQAAVSLFTDLFGKQGLLILDADHPDLKRAFLPKVLEDISVAKLKPAVESVNEQLTRADYHLQARPLDINYFMLGEGKRERIDFIAPDRVRWSESGREMSREELMEEMKADPARISPNVITRPIYQEFVLPNVVFIGGGGEVAYWMQLGEAFRSLGIPMPILAVRNSFMLQSHRAESLRAKLGLKPEELFLSRDEQIRIVLKSEEQLDVSDEIKTLESAFASISERIAEIDPTLIRSAEAELANVRSRVEHLRQKALRALKQRNETKLGQLDKLREELFPGGILQERTLTLPEAMMRCGDDVFDIIRQLTEPLNTDFKLPVFSK